MADALVCWKCGNSLAGLSLPRAKEATNVFIRKNDNTVV
jgi:hypothetical protein